MADENKQKSGSSRSLTETFMLPALANPLMWGLWSSYRIVMAEGSGQRNALGLNEGIKDSIRDTYYFLALGATGLDKHNANQRADNFDQWWHKHITQNVGLGDAEFRMGGGWKLPVGTILNGKLLSEKMDSAPFDAVFVKNKTGKVEVMTHDDPRYVDIALPYIVAAVASPMAGGKAVAILKGLENLPKVVKGAEVAEKLTTRGMLAAQAADIGLAVHESFILEPAAISKIAHLMDDPSKMNPSVLRKELNTIFEQYSFRNGPNAEQYFMPQIKPNEDPIKRLEELSQGSFSNLYERKNPFDRNPTLRKDVDVTQNREKVVENLYFQKGFFELAHKSMSGQSLSDQEMVLLSFGANILTGSAFPVAPAKGASFSEHEKAEIKENVKLALEGALLSDPEKDFSIHEVDKEITNRLADVKIGIEKQESAQRKIFGGADPKQKDPMAVFSL